MPGPYVAKIVCESTNTCPSNHHEDAKLFETEFCLREIKLIRAFKQYDNSFSDPPEELMSIVSKALTSSKASSSVRSVLQIGESQCNSVTKERLNAVNTKQTSLHASIIKNNLTSFKSFKSAVIVSKEKQLA